MARGDGHSRLVAWLKIVLPLIALAMLSTLFLVSHRIDPGQTIPYADVDVEGLARDQRIGAPSFSALTPDGAAISFEADSARPEDGGSRLTAVNPRARIDLPDGRSVTIRAATAMFDRGEGTAELDGDAVVTTSDGYRIATAGLRARLDRAALETTGAIVGTGPMGDLAAGRMRLTQAEDGRYLLRFDSSVKVVYRPES